MRKRQKTFSKGAVKFLLVIAIFDLQLSYLLAFLGREEIAETLSITVVTEIIAVMLGYFLKSYKETKEQESVRLIEKQQETVKKQGFVNEMRKGIENDVAN